jgi:valyl-tRNA synthetase
MLEKTYQPAALEARIHEVWMRAHAFEAMRPERAAAEPYCILIPPPNVTGSLHMGHALNNTLQDVLCRFERMRGKDVLWQPGTDHAGIATQLVVERQLMELQQPRRTLGREKFIEKVWAWKAESGGTILKQLQRLGASCDWSRERFTMDQGLSEAVLKVFVELYNEGLIYKDKRLVNWDPEFQSALSDLEVDMVEVKGSLWYVKYPFEDDPARYVVVATTRPETMLGDVAVAVHPDDPRYKGLVGKRVVLPLVGRTIPIIADAYSDPAKGSGAVKITPAHDFHDYEVGKRHNLPLINIFDAQARTNDAVPSRYRGLDRSAARQRVLEDLTAQGLLDRVEGHVHAVPHAQRGGAVIEPWLTDQWYVNAAGLAQRATAAVEEGRTQFVPKNWEKTYFEWMRNIQPWCISRQLWWGHRIPAWYGPDGKVFVAASEADAYAQARAFYAKADAKAAASGAQQSIELRRDEDVLDTWFSSALWPFSTLGWPHGTPELARFYPSSVLVTAFDIIFFWVARMMMMGLHFMGEVPFRDVYIHALVRDDKGQKMSKTKGNVLDPLVLIDRYGADALRFTLAAMAAQGRDIKLSPARVEGYRNFATKLWNAARFAEMNACRRGADFDPRRLAQTVNRWIAGEVERTACAVTAGITSYRFNEAAGTIYDFTWGTFCDWYLELVKPLLAGSDAPAKAETRAVTAWVLDQILKLLHPFMPFVSEELWARLAERDGGRQDLLCLSSWPQLDGLADADADADAEMRWVIKLVSEVRSVRSEMNVPASATIPLLLIGAGEAVAARAGVHATTLQRLARLSAIDQADAAPAGAAQIVFDDTVAALPLAGVIDMRAERARLSREIEKAAVEIGKIDRKLANTDFLVKAPPEVVEENRERRTALEAVSAKLETALKRLAPG